MVVVCSCKAEDADRALVILSQHQSLVLLNGNPARTFHYVQLLSSTVEVNHLPELIKAEEHKRFDERLGRTVSDEAGREVWRAVAGSSGGAQKYEAPWKAVCAQLCSTFVTKCQTNDRGLDDKDLSVIRHMLSVSGDSKDDSAPVTLEYEIYRSTIQTSAQYRRVDM